MLSISLYTLLDSLSKLTSSIAQEVSPYCCMPRVEGPASSRPANSPCNTAGLDCWSGRR